MHRVLIEHPHISSYSFCLLFGFFAGFLLARWNAKRSGLEGRHVDNVTLLLVVTGIVGARIFSWLFYFPPGIGFWKALFYPGGGLVFYGGVVFGVATVILYTLLTRVSLRTFADVLAAPLALGLAFGRIGCFMAGCCWGDLCVDDKTVAALTPAQQTKVQTLPIISRHSFPLAVRFPQDTGALNQHHRLGLIPHSAERSLPVHPVQLYEAFLVFALGGWLQWRRAKPHPAGQLFCLFAVGYGIIRFAVEFMRADNSQVYWGMTISQGISIVAIAACLPLLRVRNPAPQVALADPKAAS